MKALQLSAYRFNPWRLLTGVMFFAFICRVSLGQTIPAWFPPNSTVDWQNAGVSGGIPNRTSIFVNVLTTTNLSYKCYGDDVHDDSVALNNALTACPSNEIVYLPAAKYLLGANNTPNLEFSQGVTLRGAGMGQTILDMYGNGQMGDGDWPPPTSYEALTSIVVTNGYMKGSSNLWLTEISANVAVGHLISINEDNPSTVSGNTNNTPFEAATSYRYIPSFTALVIAINNNVVTLNHPLPISFTNNPHCAGYNYIFMGDSIEDLTMNNTNVVSPNGIGTGNAVAPISFTQCYGCWLFNVEIEYCAGHFFSGLDCVNCQIQDCYAHNQLGSAGGSEGIDWVGQDCYNLTENNICNQAGFPEIINGDGNGGNCGNVVAFNFLANLETGAPVTGGAIGDNHGPHQAMNLYEGNVAQSIWSDGYYGSSEHGTFFRNWFTGQWPESSYSFPMIVSLGHWSYNYNIIGNVLGSPNGPANWYPQGLVYTTSQLNYGGNVEPIFRFGYPNMGGNENYDVQSTTSVGGGDYGPGYDPSAYDLNVWPSTFVEGNYDFANNAVTWTNSMSALPSGMPPQTLPASLYLASQPTWWTNWGTTPWPPIGPDVAGMTNNIPAQLRFTLLTTGNYSDPGPGNANSLPPVPPTNLRAVGP